MALLVVGMGFVAALQVARADVISWNDAAGGNWNDPLNWTPNQVPGAADDARIDMDGTYSVTLDVNAQVASLTLGAASGAQTLAISLFTLTLDGASSVGSNGVLELSSGAVTGAGDLIVDGQLDWSGGTMSGAATTTVNGPLNLSGAANKDLTQRTVETTGTTTWTGTGDLRTGQGSVFRNMGTFEAQNDELYSNTFGGVTAFDNQGTFRKSVGTATTTMGVAFDNTGTVDVQTGTLSLAAGSTSTGGFSATGVLQFAAGTHELDSGAGVTGSGTVRMILGTVNLNSGAGYNVAGATELVSGTFNVASGSTAAAASLTQSGGISTGDGTLTVGGLLTWTAGTMNGTGTTEANGGMVLSGAGLKDLTQRTLVNAGTATWTGTGDIRTGLGSFLRNTGTFEAQNDEPYSNTFGGVTTFDNQGTFRKSVGVGTTTLGITFDNAGSVDVQSGTLILSGGGTSTGSFTASATETLQFGGGVHAFNSPAGVTAAGTVRFSGGTTNLNTGSTYDVSLDTIVSGGTANFNAGATVTDVGDLTVSSGTGNLSSGVGIQPGLLVLSGGTLTGSDTVTVAGVTTWSGGTMTGSGTTRTDGGMNISGSAVKDLTQRTLETSGTTTWTGTGDLRTGQGSFTDNLATGTWEVQNDEPFSNTFGGATTFRNQGTFRKSVGVATTTMGIAFDNTGAVDVQTGTLSLAAGSSSTGGFTATGMLQFAAGTHELNSGAGVAGAGTVRMVSGTVNLNSGASYNVAGATELVSGTFLVASGSTAAAASLTQSGGISTGDGTLTVGGLLTWTAGMMNGTGTTEANGGMVLSGAGLKDLTQRTLVNAGTATWTGTGDIRTGLGSFFRNTGTFEAQNDEPYSNTFGGVTTFDNQGTFRKSVGVGTTTLGITFDNTGSVDVQSGTLILSSGGTSTGSFAASATETLQFGGGVHALDSPAGVTASGTVRFSGGTTNLNTGSTYDVSLDTIVSGGTANFNAGTTVTDVGDLTVSSGTGNFSSGIGIQPGLLVLSGGTLTGSDTVTVAGVTTWSGGTMTGSGTTRTDGGMNISGPALKDFTQRTLETNGTTTWSGIGDLRTGQGSFTDNLATGTWEVQNDEPYSNTFGGATTFHNQGTFRKSVGVATTTMGVAFSNTGTVDVQTGTLSLAAGSSSTGGFSATGMLQFAAGTHELNSGAGVAGAGTVQMISGTVNLNSGAGYNVAGATELVSGTFNVASGSTATAASFTQSGGISTGDGTLTVGGLLTWTAGMMNGTGTTEANGGMVLSGAGLKDLTQRTLVNAGTATWTGTGDIRTGLGSFFRNTGTFEAQNDEPYSNTFGGATTFDNQGTFRKSVGAGTTTLAITFDNAGLFEVQTGTAHFISSYTQVSGVTRLNGGSISTTSTLDIQDGTLEGFGTASGNVQNSGQLSPGLSPAILDLAGSYTQTSAGSYDVELGGLTAGNDFDQFRVTSAGATLSGALDVSLINAFSPSLGDSFTVMTFPSRAGVFSSTSFPALGPGLQWNVSYGNTTVILSIGPVQNADLSVVKVDDVDPILVGETLAYTITILNNGPDDATTVVLQDTLPAGVTFVSALSTQGSCLESGGTITCEIGDLLLGASAIVTIDVIADAAGMILNAATAVANESDPVPSSATDTESTTVLSACQDNDNDLFFLCDTTCLPESGSVCGDCDDVDPDINPDASEVCDEVDNDCNGAVDDGLWAIPELCNGEDENCNGIIDEGNPEGGAACSTGQAGICDAGTEICEFLCVGGVQDGLDCIVATDPATCSSNGGACTAGLSCLQDVGPGPELCNGTDDNCDGTIDESADSDGDGVDNCSDNCPDAFNPVEDCDVNPGTPDEQCDADSDDIGDLCDCTPNDPTNPLPLPVDDSVQIDNSSGQTVIGWNAVPDVGLYNVYRGYFTEGNTYQYNHQCLDVNVPITSAVDPLEPRPFTLFYYLVTSTCGGPVESSLGQDSLGIPRPQPFGCPSATLDLDGDGTEEALDNCPGFQNPSQSDFDNDSHGDVCDSCPQDFDPSLGDIDGDGLGDVCDPDRDGDTVPDDGDGNGTPGDNPCPDGITMNCDDNCPDIPNPGQEDTDMDGAGDACDP